MPLCTPSKLFRLTNGNGQQHVVRRHPLGKSNCLDGLQRPISEPKGALLPHLAPHIPALGSQKRNGASHTALHKHTESLFPGPQAPIPVSLRLDWTTSANRRNPTRRWPVTAYLSRSSPPLDRVIAPVPELLFECDPSVHVPNVLVRRLQRSSSADSAALQAELVPWTITQHVQRDTRKKKKGANTRRKANVWSTGFGRLAEIGVPMSSEME